MIRRAIPEDTDILAELLNQLGYDLDPSVLKGTLSGQESVAAIYVFEQETQVIGFIATARLFYFPTLQYLTWITAICSTKVQG